MIVWNLSLIDDDEDSGQTGNTGTRDGAVTKNDQP